MVSNRLSRWTLLCFACALGNFLLAQGLILAGLTWPARPALAPGTLIAVHLLTVGWLLLMMWGALFQFVPVITSRALVSQALVLVTLIAVEIGLLGLICGFLGIAEGRPALTDLLPAGGAAVLAGVLIASWNVGAPLLRTRPLPLPGRMVLTGLIFLIVTVALGSCFALALSVPWLALPLAPLLAGVGEHALAGLGGWLTLTAMGVSYRLLPMFLLAPDARGIAGECAYVFGTLGFALAITGGLALGFRPAGIARIGALIGYAAIALAVVFYLWDVARIYRTRRRTVELHNQAAIGAFVLLGLATVLALVCVRLGRLDSEAPVIVFLVLFGWLGGLGLSQLYKIVPFLTWLARYGGNLGRGAVPRLQDLVKDTCSRHWFITYFFSVFFAALSTAVAPGHALREHVFRACMALTLLASLALSIEYWRAWRGHYVRLDTSITTSHRGGTWLSR